MLTGFGIITSSILSTCLTHRQMHSLAAGMLSTRASPGGYCLPFLQVSTPVEKRVHWFLTTHGLRFVELHLESMSTFSTVAALGTEKPFGWALCQALQKNTYSCAPRNCWRHPPSLVKGESLKVGEADDGCRHSEGRGKGSRKEDWKLEWDAIALCWSIQ